MDKKKVNRGKKGRKKKCRFSREEKAKEGKTIQERQIWSVGET